MNIAVTGANGFVGRHVVADLDRRGIQTTLVVRSAAPPEMAAGHRIVSMDLAQPPGDPYGAMGSPDILIHLAWSGLPHYQSSRHVDEELPAQYRFLQAMVAGGLRNLLVSGTCLEYGMQSGRLHEGLEARPVTAYGRAKNALRAQLETLRDSTPFRLTWARLFYLYGPGQATTSLYAQLARAAERGDTMFPMSGGKQIRDYLRVSLAARVIVSLALATREIGVVNVCSGVPASVGEMVEKWIAENRWSIELNRGPYPYPDYEPMEFWGDATKLISCLKFECSD